MRSYILSTKMVSEQRYYIGEKSQEKQNKKLCPDPQHRCHWDLINYHLWEPELCFLAAFIFPSAAFILCNNKVKQKTAYNKHTGEDCEIGLFQFRVLRIRIWRERLYLWRLSVYSVIICNMLHFLYVIAQQSNVYVRWKHAKHIYRKRKHILFQF